ncbi:MAG: hypothetical protein AAF846_14255 [Chloroflexota bacterium]
MVYKVYISTHDKNEMYVSAVQRALFAINEIGLSGLNVDDMPQLGRHRHVIARATIQQADVFLAIYDGTLGIVPEGETQSELELEYQTAVEQDTARLIFVLQGAYEQAEARQQEFLAHVMQNDVITTFEDADDLVAQVKVAMDNYKQTRHQRRRLRPPATTSLRDRVPILPEQPVPESADEEATIEETIERALDEFGGEVEQIVRRALELHEAQRQVTEKSFEDFDNKITVEPMWGEPLRRSQFQSDIFMIMPFREQYNALYENVIVPVAADLNLTIKRGDDFASTRGSIMQEVWSALNACKLVICETTEVNANVYYELGIAHTLGKPAILLTQTKDIEQLPFDIRHLRFTVYEDSIEGSKTLEASLRQSIIWLLNDLDEQTM